MATLTRSIMIDAPVATVFDFALDIRQLWKVKDVALTEVDVKPDGVGTSARMYTHLLGFHLEGGIEYTEVIPGQRTSRRFTSSRKSPRGRSRSNPPTTAPR